MQKYSCPQKKYWDPDPKNTIFLIGLFSTFQHKNSHNSVTNSIFVKFFFAGDSGVQNASPKKIKSLNFDN